MRKPEDKFINKIQEVFDEYQDDSADLGWESFEKLRRNDKPNRSFVMWAASAAAIVLMACGVWFFNANIEKSEFVVKKTDTLEQKVEINTNIVKPLTNTPNPLTNADNLNASEKRTSALPQKGAGDGKNTLESNKWANVSNSTSTVFNDVANQVIVDSIQANDFLTGKKLANDGQKTELLVIKPATTDSSQVRVQEKTLPAPVNASVAIIQSAEKLSKIIQNKKSAGNKSEKAIALSVYAGTHFNYSKGSENSLNLGFGLSSDFKLAKNLKLSTGIALAQNSLKYSSGNQWPETASAGLAVAVNNSNYQKDIMDSNPLQGLLNGFGAAAGLSRINNFNANLLSLDIPINLKYQILSKKNKLYVLTGLSSGTYLNEVYTYKYTQSYNLGNQAVINPQGSEVSSNASNNFYLARTLNISAGLSTPLTKTQELIIEPFLKYPLGGLGEQNIKFGAAGLNLKLNFNNSSKNK